MFEDVIFLIVPMRGSTGTVYGVCGIELNAVHFQLLYPAVETSFGPMVTVAAPVEGGSLRLSEGMAGGVGLGGVDGGAARRVALGIALQNLPEGAVMIPPLLSAGVRRSRAACIALATGLLNAAGVVAGALWGHLSGSLLPLALCFAGGAMLDVIVSQMIPQVVCSGRLKQGPQIVLGGFAIMAVAAALF